MNKTSKSDKKAIDKIIISALQLSEIHGWSDDLVTALHEAHSTPTVTRYFPNGLMDITYGFANWADEEMIERLENIGIDNLKIRARIYEGVKARLEVLTPHKTAFKSSMKYLMRPSHAFDLKKISWRTADRLWWTAGDRATDYNHYTKRILLSGVFASTTLFWLRDTSGDNQKTWNFLDKRINNVLKIGKFMSKFKKSA